MQFAVGFKLQGKSGHALVDGEDFELLVCGDGELGASFGELMPVGTLAAADGTNIGQLELVTAQARVPIEPRGYEHFR